MNLKVVTIERTVHSKTIQKRLFSILFFIGSTILFLSSTTNAYLPPPLERVQRDFLALTRKATARHILLPKSNIDAALTLKQKIRNKVNNPDEPCYVIDIFEEAARRYSMDKTTSERGGLLAELAPQGYCVVPELDKACFTVPLGDVAGPIESDYGYHLILVSERTNCPKLDGKDQSRLIRGDDGRASLTGPRPVDNNEVMNFLVEQFILSTAVSLGGLIIYELAAKIPAPY